MLLKKTVIVKWNPANRKYYESKGYIFTKWKDEFEVRVEDLSKGSHSEVEILCDYCKINVILREYREYLKLNKNSIINKDCCEECRILKMQESNLLIYNVKYTSQTSEFKNKISEAHKRINEDSSLRKTIEEKRKSTNLSRYGAEYPSQNIDINNKMKQTNLNKYGFENVFQNEEIKQKSKLTSLEHWGTEHPMQNDIIRGKAIMTLQRKYGCDVSTQNEDIKEKVRLTSLNRYGGYYVQTDEFKERFKNTSLEHWGTEHPMQNPVIKNKAIQTLYKNGTCKTSTQQLYIYNLLKDNNYNIELNYPISNVNLDVAIFINNIKIDLEYDGWYWHDLNKDRRRDEFLKSEGWKILRIKSGNLLPTLGQLKETINYLVNNENKNYAQIILNDWKVNN